MARSFTVRFRRAGKFAEAAAKRLAEIEVENAIESAAGATVWGTITGSLVAQGDLTRLLNQSRSMRYFLGE